MIEEVEMIKISAAVLVALVGVALILKAGKIIIVTGDPLPDIDPLGALGVLLVVGGAGWFLQALIYVVLSYTWTTRPVQKGVRNKDTLLPTAQRRGQEYFCSSCGGPVEGADLKCVRCGAKHQSQQRPG
jgi:hypothetical protein